MNAAHQIYPTHVMGVLRNGGHIRVQVDASGNTHLVMLLDAHGVEVPTQPQAVCACMRHCQRYSNLRVQSGARIELWRLPPEPRHD
ncbi:MAG TPA: hypothetical protein VFK31_09535 [Rhodanobacteraceae bacterium]|nr:hypothetical protein [Rhodanobacteraceae bacterium]